MTTKELSQLYYLSKEIAMNREHLARLETIANSTTPQLTGMPGTVGAKDRLGKVMAEIMDVKAILERNLQKYWYEYNRLTRYIADIDDSLVRQIMTLRYIELLTWQQVAYRIGETDESYPRRKHNEYLKNIKLAENAENNLL